MALFHVLFWKAEFDERRLVAQYKIDAPSAKEAIDQGQAMFQKQHPDKPLKEHLVRALPW